MPWPRGQKRVGYVKKDGTPHAKKGERITAIRREPAPYTQTRSDKEPRVEKTGPVLHGQTGQPVIEPCPNCGFAYADGGACPECDWTRFDPNCPHCTRGK